MRRISVVAVLLTVIACDGGTEPAEPCAFTDARRLNPPEIVRGELRNSDCRLSDDGRPAHLYGMILDERRRVGIHLETVNHPPALKIYQGSGTLYSGGQSYQGRSQFTSMEIGPGLYYIAVVGYPDRYILSVTTGNP